MERTIATGAALAVAWIARETIYVGQVLIRTAYGWLKWSQRHASSAPPELRSQSPSEDAPAGDTEGSEPSPH